MQEERAIVGYIGSVKKARSRKLGTRERERPVSRMQARCGVCWLARTAGCVDVQPGEATADQSWCHTGESAAATPHARIPFTFHSRTSCCVTIGGSDLSLPRTASSLPEDAAGYSTGCWCTEHERHDSGAQSLDEEQDVDECEDADAICAAAAIPTVVVVVRIPLRRPSAFFGRWIVARESAPSGL